MASVVIGEKEIKRRLSEDLVVSPILDPASQIQDCSINLRLGMNVVVPRLSEHKAIDPRELSKHNIAMFQRPLQLSFGEEFMIHPGRLLLASTFEFIGLPEDVCGYVLSRSCYGRLGLIVATATFVHPNWKGCLTLELANEGELPISLKSGAPVAQLVLQSCDRVPRKKLKDVPLGPQYRQAAAEEEWGRIDRIARITESYERE